MATRAAAMTRSKGSSQPSATAAKLPSKTPASLWTKSQSASSSCPNKKPFAAKPAQKTLQHKPASRKKKANKLQEPVPALVQSTQSSTESEDSDASLTGKKSETTQRPRRKNRSSATLPQQQKRTAAPKEILQRAIEVTEQVYCGPTFSNAPAPSALPMPAFLPQQRARPMSVTGSGLRPAVESPPESFFMEDYLHHQSKEILHLLSPRQSRHQAEPLNHQHHWPTKLSTSHELDTDRTLSEIQRGLRSMLKIEA